MPIITRYQMKRHRKGTVLPAALLAGCWLMLVLLTGCGGGGGDADVSTGSPSSPDTGPTATIYAIGGTVSGLIGGSGLTLQNNGGDDLVVNSDGSFTFATGVADGAGYSVTVANQPSGQFCNVYNYGGTVAGADVGDIDIRCVTGLYNVVDTFQDTCYDSTTGAAATCSGVGYDADYSGHQPSYTVSDDGKMVTDNVTGLIWTRSPDTNGDGVVDYGDKMHLADAESYCADLDDGGFAWRLPTIKELFSLMDYRGVDPSSYSGTDISVLTPFIDPAVFVPSYGDTSVGERIIDGQFATATLYVSPLGTISGNATMFGVNFADGRIKGYPYDFPANDPKAFYVLCVTGNPYYGENDFVDNGNQTVSDRATGLMWEKNDYHSINFEDAVAHCENASTGGYADWRLPNAKELQSIVDYDRAPDFTDSAAIDPVFNATAITNEGGETDWGYYWSSTTHVGYPANGNDAAYDSFGRALGYFNATLTDVHGAGAVRSNDKSSIASPGSSSADLGYGTFYYKGPQGDILRIDNLVRCVRDDTGN